jgi:hypothetical protein
MAHNVFLEAEDKALKTMLQELRYTDTNNVRKTPKVFFRYPEGSEENVYPFVTITMLDIQHDRSKQHSFDRLTVYPDGETPDEYTPDAAYYWPDVTDDAFEVVTPALTAGQVAVTTSPLPVRIIYQIETYCRSIFHDRDFVRQMLGGFFTPFRHGIVLVPEDNTSREMFLLDFQVADLADQEAGYRKAIHRKIYTVSVNAEIPATSLETWTRVTTVVDSLTLADDASVTG